MDSYLSKILELGIEEGDEVKLSEKQTKDIISQKMLSTQGGKRKKKRGAKGGFDNGLTEEQMIAEQKRLFENARLGQSDSEEDDSGYQQE